MRNAGITFTFPSKRLVIRPVNQVNWWCLCGCLWWKFILVVCSHRGMEYGLPSGVSVLMLPRTNCASGTIEHNIRCAGQCFSLDHIHGLTQLRFNLQPLMRIRKNKTQLWFYLQPPMRVGKNKTQLWFYLQPPMRVWKKKRTR